MAKRSISRYSTGFVDFEQETDCYSGVGEWSEAVVEARAARDPLRLADHAEELARWVFQCSGFPLNTSGLWHRIDGGPIMPGSGPDWRPGMKIECFRDTALAEKAGHPLGSLMAWASQLAGLALMYRLAVGRGDLADAAAGAYEISQTIQRLFRFSDRPADGKTVDDAARERIEGKRKRAASAAKGSAARTAGSLAARQRLEAERILLTNPRISDLALAREVAARVGGTERAVRRVLAAMTRKNTVQT